MSVLMITTSTLLKELIIFNQVIILERLRSTFKFHAAFSTSSIDPTTNLRWNHCIPFPSQVDACLLALTSYTNLHIYSSMSCCHALQSPVAPYSDIQAFTIPAIGGKLLWLRLSWVSRQRLLEPSDVDACPHVFMFGSVMYGWLGRRSWFSMNCFSTWALGCNVFSCLGREIQPLLAIEYGSKRILYRLNQIGNDSRQPSIYENAASAWVRIGSYN